MNCSLSLKLAAALLASGISEAQTTSVAPIGFGYASSGGSWQALHLFDGLQGVRAMQVIREDAVGFSNEAITELAFRHSSFWNQAYASEHFVNISLGYTSLAPDQLPTTFSEIPSGVMTEVYSHPFSVPASTDSSIPESWTVVFPLDEPFLYDASLGNLVLEIRSTYMSGDLRTWPADVHARTAEGSGFQRTGPGCDGLTSQLSWFGSSLLPGGNVSFSLRRPSLLNLFGAAYVGIPNPNLPLDLTGFGAPGCIVEVDPLASQPANIMGQLHDAIGLVNWSIPPQPGLAGVAFDHQAALFNSPSGPNGITLSTSHRLYLGSPGAVPVPATNTLKGAHNAAIGSLPSDPSGWVVRFTTTAADAQAGRCSR